MFKNFITLILKSLRYRPVRSWLTVLGIVIGITLVVIILSLGAGIQNAVTQTLQMFGSDLIIIFPGKETDPFAGLIGGSRFRTKDILDLQTIPGVAVVGPHDFKTFTVEYQGEKKSVLVHAIPLSAMRVIFEQSRGIKFDKGTWPATEDSDAIILGYLAANDLFKYKVRAGDEVIVQGKRLTVSGIIARLGIQEDDNSMFVSWSVAQAVTGTSPRPISAMVKVAPGANVAIIAQEIKSRLSRQEVVRDFSVLTPDQAGNIIGSVLSIIELALTSIALVSLIVGAVGIMNTMYTAVLERTKQIGIMKSIGATNDAVLSLFLIESGAIGLVGGLLGIVIGLAASFAIGQIAGSLGVHGLFSFASVDYLGLFVILIITFITGVIAGILPARQAAKMEPAEALRYE